MATEISKKITALEEKINASEKKVAREKDKIKAMRKELSNLRFLRYTATIEEYKLSDDELMDFIRRAKQHPEELIPSVSGLEVHDDPDYS